MDRSLFICIVVAVAFLPVGAAQDCDPSTSEPEVSAGGFYLDNDPCQLDCVAGAYLYQESNGMDGLQRHDSVKTDICSGQIEPDTWLNDAPDERVIDAIKETVAELRP